MWRGKRCATAPRCDNHGHFPHGRWEPFSSLRPETLNLFIRLRSPAAGVNPPYRRYGRRFASRGDQVRQLGVIRSTSFRLFLTHFSIENISERALDSVIFRLVFKERNKGVLSVLVAIPSDLLKVLWKDAIDKYFGVATTRDRA